MLTVSDNFAGSDSGDNVEGHCHHHHRSTRLGGWGDSDKSASDSRERYLWKSSEFGGQMREVAGMEMAVVN